ncbi:hypothetical protein GN956_G24523 [Arapaima gigas]
MDYGCSTARRNGGGQRSTVNPTRPTAVKPPFFDYSGPFSCDVQPAGFPAGPSGDPLLLPDLRNGVALQTPASLTQQQLNCTKVPPLPGHNATDPERKHRANCYTSSNLIF